MQSFAYGSLQLLPNQFWALTPKEYTLMCEGWTDKEEREHKVREVEWHLLRFIGVTVYNAHRGKEKPISGTDLIKLSFDKNEQKQLSKSEFEAIIGGNNR